MLKRILPFLVCLFALAGSAVAQTGTVTVSASNLTDSSGNPISNAVVYFAPVNSSGQAISYRYSGKGQVITRASQATVTNGAFSLTLPDTSMTSPLNVCFAVTVIDNNSGNNLLGPGYGCVQPAYTATSPSSWCANGACDFDDYVPDEAGLAVIQTGPAGPGGPNCSATSPSGTCQVTGNLQPKMLDGTLYADQFSTGTGASSNGISMAVDECQNNLSYACQILAPAFYAQADLPNWEAWQWSNNAQQQYGSTTTQNLTDYRFPGSSYYAATNPDTQMPGTTNVFAGYGYYVPYSGFPSSGTNGQLYLGAQIGTWHFSGGYEQMTYGGAQSQVGGLRVSAGRNTAESGSVITETGYAWAPGDMDTQIHLFGPGGCNNSDDECVAYYSNVNDATPDVPYGSSYTIGTGAAADQVTATFSAFAGTQGERRLFLDTSGVVAATPTSINNQVQQLSSPYGYLSTMVFPTSTIHQSSAWGTITAAVPASGTNQPPGVQSVSYTAASGSMSASALTCVVDENSSGLGNGEQIYPSSVAGGSMTAYFDFQHPSGALWYQGGDCGKAVEIVADTTPVGYSWANGETTTTVGYSVKYPWMVVGSTDGVTEIVFTGSNLDNVAGILGFGSRWGNSNYSTSVNFYPAMLVSSVVGTSGDTSGGVFTFNAPVSANSGFHAGDAWEESQPSAQAHSVGVISVSQNSPGGSQRGPMYEYRGRFSDPYGGEVQLNLVPITQYDYTQYQSSNNGGADGLPGAAYYCEGAWGSCLFYNRNVGNVNALISWFSGGPYATSDFPLFRPNAGGSLSNDAFAYDADAGSSYSSSSAWDLLIGGSVIGRFWSGGLTMVNGKINGNISNNPTYNVAAITLGCGAYSSCSAMTDGYQFANSANAAGGADVFKYYPSVNEWTLTAGATGSNGSGNKLKVSFGGSSSASGDGGFEFQTPNGTFEVIGSTGETEFPNGDTLAYSGQHLATGVSNELTVTQGSCTMSSGACSAQTLGHTYNSAPVCTLTWTGTGTLTGILKVPGTTTTTVTPTSSVNTDTAQVNFTCVGN
jgi:hypothetical protein